MHKKWWRCTLFDLCSNINSEWTKESLHINLKWIRLEESSLKRPLWKNFNILSQKCDIFGPAEVIFGHFEVISGQVGSFSNAFLYLRLHIRLKLTYFRSILGYFGSFIQVIRLYGSFIRVFQTFFKRALGLSWILISQNLFSESKVRAFNSLIVYLSFYWHLKTLLVTDSTV